MHSDNYILSIDCDWVKTSSQHKDLLSYYSEKIKNVDEVYFSYEHQFHYAHVDEESIVVNIDDHHDLGYNESQHFNIKYGAIEEAAWVLGLINHKKLKGLIWVSNSGSCSLGISDKLRHLDTYKRYYEIEDIRDFEYNKILVCESIDYGEISRYVYISLIEIAKAMNKKVIFIDHEKNTKKYAKK